MRLCVIPQLSLKSKIFLLFILFSALLIRIHQINLFDLWFDELGTNLFTAQYLQNLSQITQESIPSLFLNNLKNDPNSFLYYLTVYGYSIVFGNGMTLRYLSAFFSILTLLAFYLLSNEFFNRKVSLMAVLLMALNPVHLWYAQEARVYSMLIFFAVLTTYYFVRCLKNNHNIDWIIYTILSLLTVFLSYLFIPLLIVFFFSLFLVNEERISFPKKIFLKWMISTLVMFSGFALISSPFFLGQFSYVKNAFWLKPPTLQSLFHTIKVFTFGYIEMNAIYWLGLALILFFCVLGILNYFEKQKKNAMFLLFCFLFPLVFIFLISKTIMPIYINRQLLYLSPFYYLFIAYGIMELKQKYLRVLCMGLICLICSASLVETFSGKIPGYDLYRLDGVFSRKKYQPILNTVRDHYQKGDLFVATDILSVNLILYEVIQNNDVQHYDPQRNFRVFFKPKTFGPTERRYIQADQFLETISPDEQNTIFSSNFLYNSKTNIEKISLSQFSPKRVWVVSANFQPQHPIVWNSYQIVTAFNKGYHEALSQEMDGISLKLFEKL